MARQFLIIGDSEIYRRCSGFAGRLVETHAAGSKLQGGRLNTAVTEAQVQFGRRYRQVREIWKIEGVVGITDRVRRVVAEWLTPKRITMPLRPSDVIAADVSRPVRPAISQVVPGEPIIVNWVIVPPGAGAGGHTTLFRIIRYLEGHGHTNRVYFYNVHRCDHRYYESIVRNYFGFDGVVASVDEGMKDAHAVFATAWTTAYPVFNSRCSGKRFYFVQDFEPYFYPIGSLSFLATNTYRMGFHAITAGKWLAEKLRTEFDMPADYFQFGCDTSQYQRSNNAQRSGIVFYARPEAERRGFELGLSALELFAARNPQVDIHLYGTKIGKLPFRFIDHGRVSPQQLNGIYNQCYAGLSLSLTNVSLVPHEMLAAGCIPIVNDTEANRIVLENEFVRYASPYPRALASELEQLVRTPGFDELSRAGAASVRSVSWDSAGETVDAIVRRVLKASHFSAGPCSSSLPSQTVHA